MLPRLVVGGILVGVCYMYKRREGVCVGEREREGRKGSEKGRREGVMCDGLCCRFDGWW